jgi:molybdenum cofactor cytidylyltransferase
MSHPQLSILIPAAGESRRLGQSKQLVKFRKGTLILNAVNAAQSIAPLEVIVITGANAKAVKDAVGQTRVRWVHNTNWSAGMGSSIASGAAMISPEAAGVMIFLCDQWRLQTADLCSIAETWQANPERIVCAKAGGQNMPPVIFPASCFSRLRALDGDDGARDILKDQPEMLTPVALPNAVFDLDTQSQLDGLNVPGPDPG